MQRHDVHVNIVVHDYSNNNFGKLEPKWANLWLTKIEIMSSESESMHGMFATKCTQFHNETWQQKILTHWQVNLTYSQFLNHFQT